MLRKFRPDIEGLRAVAVLGVVIFHIAPLRLQGGYIGVDVFYVISGFLITSIIRDRLERHSFSLTEFFSRRIRRLLPAHLALLIVVMAVTPIWSLPDEVESTAISAVASSIYVSNIYFASVSGYFNSQLESNPLLHTWSLSVEEQYYLVFPLLMMLLASSARHVAAAWMAVLAILSFALAQWLIVVNENVAFFIMPTRFWEFCIGGILACTNWAHAWRGGLRDGAAALGLAAIVASFFLLHEGTPMPGIHALPATVGTGLIILAGMNGRSRLSSLALENPASRFIGRISYSVYLWHWPIVVFYEMRVAHTNPFEKALLLLASLVLGAASWYWIERRFLAIPITGNPLRFFKATVGGIACVSLVAGAFILNDGFSWRFNNQQRRMISVATGAHGDQDSGEDCFLEASKEKDPDDFDYSGCIHLSKNSQNVLLLGDSHMDHYLTGFEEVLDERHLSIVNASQCRPLVWDKGVSSCIELYRHVIDQYVKKKRFDAIVVAARWQERDILPLTRTIKELSPHVRQIYVIGPVVEYLQDLPRLLAFGRLEDADDFRTWSRLMEKRELDRKLRQAVQALEKVTYISAIDTMCGFHNCRVITPDGFPMQSDYGHLSRAGSIEMVARFKAQGLLRGLSFEP